MAYLLRNRRCDLVKLAEELSESFEDSADKLELREIIMNSSRYEEEDVKYLLEGIIAERKEIEEKEREEQKLIEEFEWKKKLVIDSCWRKQQLKKEVNPEKLKLPAESSRETFSFTEDSKGRSPQTLAASAEVPAETERPYPSPMDLIETENVDLTAVTICESSNDKQKSEKAGPVKKRREQLNCVSKEACQQDKKKTIKNAEVPENRNYGAVSCVYIEEKKENKLFGKKEIDLEKAKPEDVKSKDAVEYGNITVKNEVPGATTCGESCEDSSIKLKIDLNYIGQPNEESSDGKDEGDTCETHLPCTTDGKTVQEVSEEECMGKCSQEDMLVNATRTSKHQFILKEYFQRPVEYLFDIQIQEHFMRDKMLGTAAQGAMCDNIIFEMNYWTFVRWRWKKTFLGITHGLIYK